METGTKLHDGAAAVLAKFNRTVRGDGSALSLTRSLGRTRDGGPTLGDIFTHRGNGPYLVTGVGSPYHVNSEWIEDNDSWSEHPDGPGWYLSYRGTPVEETPSETEERLALAASRTASLEASAAKAAADKAAHESFTATLPPAMSTTGPGPGKAAWAAVPGHPGYDEAVIDGHRVVRHSVSSHDDHREYFYAPEELARKWAFAWAEEVGIDAEKATEFLARYSGCHGADLYKRVLTADPDTAVRLNASADRRRAKEADKKAVDAARDIAHKLPTGSPERLAAEETWSDLGDAYARTHGLRDAIFSPRRNARNEDARLRYEAAVKGIGYDFRSPIQDDETYKADRLLWVEAGDEAARDRAFARLAELEAAARTALAYAARVALAGVGEKLSETYPAVLVPYLVRTATEGWDGSETDPVELVKAVAAAVRDGTVDSRPGDDPAWVAFVSDARYAAAERAMGEKMVRVTGNTYPKKDAIKKIPGASFKGGAWKIPKKHVGKLPKGLSYEE